jgi:undecaprenyl pyrophosphate phosphatase UppP
MGRAYPHWRRADPRPAARHQPVRLDHGRRPAARPVPRRWARFAFLLATPAIAGAGLLKLPELTGPEGHGILGQVLAGSLVAGLAAYLSLRYLTRYFETRTLTPFAIDRVAAGLASLAWFGQAS